MNLLRRLSFVALALLPSVANAQVPSYSVERFCRQGAQTGGAFSHFIYGACLDQERAALRDLVARWPQIPRETRLFCDRAAGGGLGSYFILQACIDQEESAAAANRRRPPITPPALPPEQPLRQTPQLSLDLPAMVPFAREPARLIDLARTADTACRSSQQDDVEVQVTCQLRDLVVAVIGMYGWCFGRRGQAQSDMRWHRCQDDSFQ